MDEGQLVAGRYRLQRIVGRGGMSVVWRALDERTGHLVAVKEQQLDRRARRAAQAVATVDHRCVAKVLANSPDWLVMEYIDGTSLAEILKRTGRLPVGQTVQAGADIASALDAVHAKGLVHRDVKPGNIMLAEDGIAKLTDFGISRVAWSDPTAPSTGVVGGTPAYVAPEVADGEEPTAASDVFSLGATLFATVEGVPVYGHGSTDNPFKMLGLARDRQISQPQRAGTLAPVLHELLHADPARRPSAARAQQLLAEACPEPVPRLSPARMAAARPGRTVPGWPPGRSARLVTGAVAAAGAAALVLALILVPGQAKSARHPAASTSAAVVGDPRTAEPCALTSAAAFNKFGEPALTADYGNFNRCDVIVQSSGGSVADVETQLEVPGPEDNPWPGKAQRAGAITVVREPYTGGECDRALILPDRNLVLIGAKEQGTGRADLCAMADTAASTALGVLRRSGVPRRASPPGRGSLAQLNACALLDARALAKVPGITASDGKPGFAGWECRWESGSTDSSVVLLFDRNGPLTADDGRPAQLAGRMAYIQPDGDGSHTCEVQVIYRQYTDTNGQPTQELLHLTVGGARPASALCGSATSLASAAAAKLPR